MKHLRSVLPVLLVIGTLVMPSTEGAEVSKAPKAAEPSSIEYATLDEALKALRAKKGVTFRNQDGWLVAEDSVAIATWLLTPVGHPAYPSMVRRSIVNKSGGAYMDTQIRCLASKAVCDRYFGGK